MIASLLNLRGLLITGGVSVALGFASGWTVRDWRADSQALAQKERAEKAQLEAIKQAYDAGAATVETEQRIVTVAGKAQSTVREIYREVEVPAVCDVPDAGKRLLDQAITSTGASAAQPDSALPTAP